MMHFRRLFSTVSNMTFSREENTCVTIWLIHRKSVKNPFVENSSECFENLLTSFSFQKASLDK